MSAGPRNQPDAAPLRCARIGAAIVLLLALPVGSASAEPALSAVVRRGDRLVVDDQPFRFVSWNVPNLALVEDAVNLDGVSPWRWPDEFEIRDALESVRQMGGTVVRPYVLSVRRPGARAGDTVHVVGPGEFNEEAFRTLDLVLKIAGEKGVRVLIPLVDNWKWWGGAGEYAAFRGKPADAFWTDPQLIGDFEQTIEFVLTRRNTLTGMLYRDDPAIFGWETGNELDAPPEWTTRIAATLKRFDPNHLVVDGRSLHGVPRESLDDPNIDVVTTHHYPNTGNNSAESVRRAIRDARGKKPYMVGEFGFLTPDEAERILDTVEREGAVGALYWSLRFHRREGGFYWHSEPAMGGLFKAFHWPGFDSGAPYQERRVVNLVRERAYRIRGLAVPPVEAPDAPKLLPITQAGMLSWRGSTGATHYRVERAVAETGPWSVAAERVGDDLVQLGPLWADESARPGESWWYRVIAFNDGGESAPGLPRGPVKTTHRLLVDELDTLDRMSSYSEGVAPAVGDARACYEDAHRAAIPPGGSVTYRVEGALASATFRLFAKTGEAPIEVLAITPDGERVAVDAKQVSPSTVADDYQYLRPVTVSVTSFPTVADGIELRNAGKASLQLGRVELRFTTAPQR
jgi:hypothetical protein